MKYNVGDKVYAPFTKGLQCLGEIVAVMKDGIYLLYNERHGYFRATKEQLDAHN